MIGAYLVGLPGAGKSTLMRVLTDGLDVSWQAKPFAHAVYYRGADLLGVQLGGHHPDFPGTDRLSMGVQPLAVRFVEARPVPLLIGEGDRLATAPFLRAMQDACSRFDVVLLDVPDEVAAERRALRGASAPKDSWLRGRATKVRNLAAAHPGHVRLDGTAAVDVLVAEAVERVAAFAALRGLDVEG